MIFAIQAFLISLSMILLVVFIHHEALSFIDQRILPRIKHPRRWHVSAIVLLLVVAHVVEIVICALIFLVCGELLELGQLVGSSTTNFQTYLYYSFASYTSLGIGDIFPIGFLRLATGIEALTGLLMIGWTASFLLVEMRDFSMEITVYGRRVRREP